MSFPILFYEKCPTECEECERICPTCNAPKGHMLPSCWNCRECKEEHEKPHCCKCGSVHDLHPLVFGYICGTCRGDYS